MALSYDEMQQLFEQIGFKGFSMRPYDAEMEYLLSEAEEHNAKAYIIDIVPGDLEYGQNDGIALLEKHYYKEANIWAKGINETEENVPLYIREWLEEYNPNIIVITGHDAYYKKKGSQNNISAYKNSNNFVKAIKEARRFEKSHDKLIIIAGACQSDYEELIKAGANFASSPKRVNIHALDPAIIATKMSLSDVRKDIDLKDIIENTKYGKNGIGGVITKGTMYTGYPR